VRDVLNQGIDAYVRSNPGYASIEVVEEDAGGPGHGVVDLGGAETVA